MKFLISITHQLFSISQLIKLILQKHKIIIKLQLLVSEQRISNIFNTLLTIPNSLTHNSGFSVLNLVDLSFILSFGDFSFLVLEHISKASPEDIKNNSDKDGGNDWAVDDFVSVLADKVAWGCDGEDHLFGGVEKHCVFTVLTDFIRVLIFISINITLIRQTLPHLTTRSSNLLRESHTIIPLLMLALWLNKLISSQGQHAWGVIASFDTGCDPYNWGTDVLPVLKVSIRKWEHLTGVIVELNVFVVFVVLVDGFRDWFEGDFVEGKGFVRVLDRVKSGRGDFEFTVLGLWFGVCNEVNNLFL